MPKLIRCGMVVFALSACGVMALAQGNQNCNCPERRTISVQATGTAVADAELAIVRVGYKLFGPDAKTAYAQASQTSNSIMQALTGSGIAKSAIESSSQVLQHTTPYDLQQLPMGSEERYRSQFTVAQSWTVRVSPNQAAQALNTAIDAGANESGWIEWDVADPSALQAKAAAQALANAGKIAEQMVQKSAVHLGHLISVNQSQMPMGGPIAFGAATAGNQAGLPSPPLAVTSRRVEYSVALYAVFAIE